MRRTNFTSVLLGSALTATAAFAQQSLETFDDLSGGNAFFAGTWEATGSTSGTTAPAATFVQGAGVFDISGSGVTNDADSYLELHFSSSTLDLTGFDAIALQATALEGNTATSLEVRLFDTAGVSAYAVLELSTLPTVGPWVANEGFNAAAVEIIRLSGGQLNGTAAVALRLDALDAVDSTAVATVHSADYNQDGFLDLSELLRVIELYNTRFGTTRTGRYLVNSESVDGFDSDTATAGGTTPAIARFHSADVDHNAEIDLSELLRVIELYNTRSGTTRTGAYHVDPSTTDGFAPGPAE